MSNEPAGPGAARMRAREREQRGLLRSVQFGLAAGP